MTPRTPDLLPRNRENQPLISSVSPDSQKAAGN